MGVHTFPKDIRMKVNLRVRLKFNLAFNDTSVQLVSLYFTRTPPLLSTDKRKLLSKCYLESFRPSKTEAPILSSYAISTGTQHVQDLNHFLNHEFKRIDFISDLYCLIHVSTYTTISIRIIFLS